jgi:Ca2+-transporting ATPase
MVVIRSGKGELEARSFAFTSLVLANLLLIIVNLSWKKTFHEILLTANKTLFIVLGGAISCLLAVLYIPFLSNLFHLAPLRIFDFLLIIIVAIISLFWFELLKIFRGSELLSKLPDFVS